MWLLLRSQLLLQEPLYGSVLRKGSAVLSRAQPQIKPPRMNNSGNPRCFFGVQSYNKAI